ncbi:MAG: ABC transporter ATP-binding protein [Desulfurococcaceae archaeon]
MVKNLNSGYGKFHILYDISLECRNGEILAILGPNGAGKTTLLNSVYGLADVYSGVIELGGEDITRLPPHKRVKKGISYVFQMFNVFPNLTVAENLRLVVRFAGLNRGEIESSLNEIYELFPILKERQRQVAGTLSGGERQMLALSLGLVRKPRVLLLDEPTAGLAVKYVDTLMEKINLLRKIMNISIVLVEQNVHKALEVADRVMVLVSGRIIYEGTPSDLYTKHDILRLYLGVGEAA